jgi:hypothetical protein
MYLFLPGLYSEFYETDVHISDTNAVLMLAEISVKF